MNFLTKFGDQNTLLFALEKIIKMKSSALKTESNQIQLSSRFDFNNKKKKSLRVNVSQKKSIRQISPLLTEEAETEIAWGGIPDLRKVCYELMGTFIGQSLPYSALQFAPILRQMEKIDQQEIATFLKNPKTNHVLVQNEWMKVVLIHWESGKYSSIHGHPEGGCVFKVLKGNLEEKRFSPSDHSKMTWVSYFQKGNMAYIDNEIAHHAVGNPFNAPAISIHVYTPGKKSPKQS